MWQLELRLEGSLDLTKVGGGGGVLIIRHGGPSRQNNAYSVWERIDGGVGEQGRANVVITMEYGVCQSQPH